MDYLNFLEEIGVTQNQCDTASALMPEPIPSGAHCCIRASEIHGLGVFSTIDFSAESLIGNMLVDGAWTDIGRYMNHSVQPNVSVRSAGDSVVAYSIGEIPPNTELTVNYRHVRDALTSKETTR